LNLRAGSGNQKNEIHQMWGMGIKGRINVAFLLIGIRSVFGIAYMIKMPSMESGVNLQFFTWREREILNLLAAGYNDEEIADDLDVSLKTVEKYLDNLMRKCNLRNRSSVIDFALEKRWINTYEILEVYFEKKRLKQIKHSHE
jgi:DNA-binding CsgD family transcriptional regulator